MALLLKTKWARVSLHAQGVKKNCYLQTIISLTGGRDADTSRGRHCLSVGLRPEGKTLSLSGFQGFRVTVKSSCGEEDDTEWKCSGDKAAHPVGRSVTSSAPQVSEASQQKVTDVKIHKKKGKVIFINNNTVLAEWSGSLKLWLITGYVTTSLDKTGKEGR